MMSQKVLIQQFDEFRMAHFGSGGQRKGLKYPKALRHAAASYFRSLPLAKFADVAAELGVGGAALKMWVDTLPKSRAPVSKLTPAFLEVEIERSQPEPAPTGPRKSLVVTCRQISLDLGDDRSELMLKMLVSALEASHGGAAL